MKTLLTVTVLALAPVVFVAPRANAEEGFVSIFNGKSLDGWEGDPVYWSVKDGAMLGTVTPQTLLKRNTFIVWRGGEVEDFELKLEFRISEKGNSGINYRSIEVPDVPHALRGYQLDIDGADRYTGNNYEERGRTFLALRGQKVVLPPGQRPLLVEQFNTIEAMEHPSNQSGWNQAYIVAMGNHLWHFVNGRLMDEVIDNDPVARKRRGLLGVQVHVGPPMTVEYRNIRLKRLPPGGLPASEPGTPVTYDNPSAMKDLMRQVQEIMAPALEAPLNGEPALTLESAARYANRHAAGKQAELVLSSGEKSFRIEPTPSELANLPPARNLRFHLEWDQTAHGYRVRSVQDGGNWLYAAP